MFYLYSHIAIDVSTFGKVSRNFFGLRKTPRLTAENQVDTSPGQFPHLPSKPWKFTIFNRR